MNKIIQLVRDAVKDAKQAFSVDAPVDVAAMPEGISPSIAATTRQGDRFIILVNDDAVIRYALLLNRLGYPGALRAVIRSVALHEVAHIRDIIDGLYDEKIYIPPHLDEARPLYNVFHSLCSLARDAIMYRRVIRGFGVEFLKEMELYEATRKMVVLYRDTVLARLADPEEIIAAMHTVASYALLEHVTGGTLPPGYDSYKWLVGLLDEVWQVPGTWPDKCKHLLAVAIAMIGMDLTGFAYGQIIIRNPYVAKLVDEYSRIMKLHTQYVSRVLTPFREASETETLVVI